MRILDHKLTTRRNTVAPHRTFDPNILNMMPIDLFNNLLRKSRDLLQRNPIITRINERRASIVINLVEKGEDELEVLGFGRLGRRILGRSLGLVLGGGGARGLAHLGIFKALKEAGIKVDLIGGTSIGAFIGGLLAREGLTNYPRVLQSVGSFCGAMSSKWRQALDLTYPATSWFTGHAFNRALWKYFGWSGIEDFSVPFFAVTTDLTRSRLQIHRTGPAWKYVRASMSLSGFLPPVCDARDGTLLVDGGYLANVPIELMQRGALTELSELSVRNDFGDEERREALSASIVIAIDVGRASDRVPIYYGDSLNGWWVLLQKLGEMFWFSRKSRSNNKDELVNPPLTLDEIQFRLAYASSAGLLSRTLKRGHVQLATELNAKPVTSFVTVNRDCDPSSSPSNSSSSNHAKLPEVIYLRPGGVQQYGTLEFNKWTEIIAIGYEYGKAVVEEWKISGLLDQILEFQGGEGKCLETAAGKRCDESMNIEPIRYRRSSI